jgi:hypothetical protein
MKYIQGSNITMKNVNEVTYLLHLPYSCKKGHSRQENSFNNSLQRNGNNELHCKALGGHQEEKK